MVAHTDDNRSLAYRVALEALRSGVPNREAVRILGCNQPRAETAFADMLNRVGNPDDLPPNAQGMLVSGDFGTGKSHLLVHLEHLALSQNFVCSKVVISKETPLYDLGKVFASAMDNGRMPDHSGRLIEELAHALDPRSREYADFFIWANAAADRGIISPMFPASLLVHERSRDGETNGAIESFWGGDRILISTVKGGLRQIGQQKTYTFRAPKAADLPPQRLRFATELIRAAGYRGWVVMLDELELVGSYSILQRGRAYAELARWMGQVVNEDYPGLVVVGTVTDDFASAIISPDGDKKDRDYVGARLDNNARYANIVSRAETGMNLLEDAAIPLNPPSDDDVAATVEHLRRIYSDAYDWPAPPLEADATGAGYQGRMRYKVRAAINEWDIRRLYPDSTPETIGDDFRTGYEEDGGPERDSDDD